MGAVKNNFKSEMQKLADLLSNDLPKVIKKAEYFALKRGLQKANKIGAQGIKREVPIRDKEGTAPIGVSDIKKELFRSTLPKRAGDKAKARLTISGGTLSMRRFVISPRTVPDQRRVPVKRRAKVRVKIMRGKTQSLRKAFLARVPTKPGQSSVQVFRRASTAARKIIRHVRIMGKDKLTSTMLPITKLTASSMANLFTDAGLIRPTLDAAGEAMDKSFRSKFRYFALKEIDRRFRINIRKI